MRQARTQSGGGGGGPRRRRAGSSRLARSTEGGSIRTLPSRYPGSQRAGGTPSVTILGIERSGHRHTWSTTRVSRVRSWYTIVRDLPHVGHLDSRTPIAVDDGRAGTRTLGADSLE